MNAMLASGGYPWTVIRVEDRNAYLAALDRASIDMKIEPFAEFIAHTGTVVDKAGDEESPHVNGRGVKEDLARKERHGKIYSLPKTLPTAPESCRLTLPMPS